MTSIAKSGALLAAVILLAPLSVACSAGGSSGGSLDAGASRGGARTEGADDERDGDGPLAVGDGGASPEVGGASQPNGTDEAVACGAFAEAARCTCPSDWQPAKCDQANRQTCETLWKCPTHRPYLECLTKHACDAKPPCGSLPSTC